jgi:hypothetical protein
MSAHRDGDQRDDPDTPTPFERFESLTRRLLHVPKDDVREAEARDQDKRRTA